MTEKEKNIEEYRSMLKTLLVRNTPKCKIPTLKKLWDKIKKTEDNLERITQLLNNMIDKLADASKLITDQNEWLDYLETAMGNQKDEIVSRALAAKKAVEKYKTKCTKKYK